MQEFNFKINGHDYNIVINDISGTTATVIVNGSSYTVDITSDDILSPDVFHPLQPHNPTRLSSPTVAAVSPTVTHRKSVVAPLPGVILSMKVGRGQAVRRGDKIAVLEAMKMENDILSPMDGTITDIFVSKGDAVLEGAKIAEIE